MYIKVFIHSLSLQKKNETIYQFGYVEISMLPITFCASISIVQLDALIIFYMTNSLRV